MDLFLRVPDRLCNDGRLGPPRCDGQVRAADDAGTAHLPVTVTIGAGRLTRQEASLEVTLEEADGTALASATIGTIQEANARLIVRVQAVRGEGAYAVRLRLLDSSGHRIAETALPLEVVTGPFVTP